MSNEQECQCGQTHGACNTEFQYAVKTVCGRMPASQGGADATPVAPGQYWTAVNIHNPDKCKGAHFRWKVAVGRPGEPGPISAFQTVRVLEPDRAIELDCRQIRNALSPVPTFVKGYVVIESDVELDVVAVYSTAQSPAGPVTSFHTERVRPRCVPVCEELILPLDTGVAGWQTVAAPSGPLGPVVPLTNVHPNWATPPFGSSWVSQVAADSQDATAGTRHYDLCFDLCFGFTVPARFNIQGLADNRATVLLNGNAVGNIPGFGTPTTLTVNPQFLRAGRNCFRVSVINDGGPTGFALAGLLRVAGGKCPCSPLPLVQPRQGQGLPTTSEPAAGALEVSSGERKVSRKGSKKGQGRKQASKKASKK
jgi:hypothetical protein